MNNGLMFVYNCSDNDHPVYQAYPNISSPGKLSILSIIRQSRTMQAAKPMITAPMGQKQPIRVLTAARDFEPTNSRPEIYILSLF